MIKIVKNILVLFVLFGFLGYASNDNVKIENTTYEKVNLDAYKTYQFIADSGVATDKKSTIIPKDMQIEEEIEDRINIELAKKGKVPAEENPDFYVAYMAGEDPVAIKDKLNKESKSTLDNVPKAALMLMFVDAKTGDILWISTVGGKMKDRTKEYIRERLDIAIKKMFKDI